MAAESLFATLFPSDCRLCGAALTEVSRLPVCCACVGSIHRIEVKVCAVCGELVSSSASEPGEIRCGLCQRARLPFARAVAYGSYDGGLRGLIHLLKYERVRPAAEALGGLLAEAMAGLKFASAEKAALVVPVPLASGRERQRGFNQAEEIARAAVRHWGRRGAVAGETKTAQARASVPHSRNELELNTSALRRTRETESQTGLTRHQRRLNLRGAFAAARPEEIAGREIILVDDVYTTGTTAYECARVLRRAGAAEIYVATAARVMKAETPGMAAEELEAAVSRTGEDACATRSVPRAE